jgi:hypothetical protein
MILILFSFFLNFSLEKYIKYNFQTKNSYSGNFPESYINNDIYINIPFGTPEQIIPLNIRLQNHITVITSEDCEKDSIKKFSYSSSITFKKLKKTKMNFSGREYEKGFKVSDTITIGENKIDNFEFLLADSINYLQSGILGLKFKENHDSLVDMNFIHQLKKKDIISSYSFSLNYLNNDNGELIIGEYPHLYNKNYLENNFVHMKSGASKSLINWIIDFDEIFYSKIRIKGIKKILLKIEFSFIIGSKEFFDVIKKEFFDNNNKCKLDNNNIYKYYICDNDVDLTKFNNVSFGLKDIKYYFNFTDKDLFFELNNKKYFQILFNVNETINEWVFGKTFFKNNFLIFDSDRKIIGMYLNLNKDKFNKSFYHILIIIFIIIIIILIIYIIFYLKKYKFIRTKRGNELELLLE